MNKNIMSKVFGWIVMIWSASLLFEGSVGEGISVFIIGVIVNKIIFRRKINTEM
ncbi:hypothetical protein [Sporosarcina luteola]|uniref:hypothetical protein n=1 Tax=Sporosarcina luteola TaxID=582850 RepID=UPI00203AF9F0|nr:hypothetical protein [Sporosarcina luteola]MCM3709182.1 hypothetical protein [Sporosarcina luteola]